MSRPLRPVIEGGDTPWRGLNEDPDAPHVPGELLELKNLYPEHGNLVGRAGVTKLGLTLAGKVQGILQFEALDGTNHTVVFAGGKMYSYNWTTDAFTDLDLATAGIALDSSASVRAVALRGKMVATDGVNKPFQWDPATATFTTLTNAPIAQDVSVYYSKAFFARKPQALSEFEWSIEGDAETGYAAQNSVWTFGQRDQGSISKLAAGNEALFVFKQDSISLVSGAANDTFQSAGTRESISESEGALGPDCVAWAKKDIYFLSQNGLRVLPGASRADPVKIDVTEDGGREWHRLKTTWATVNRAWWQTAIAAYEPNLEQVLFAVPTSGSALDTVIGYSIRDKGLFLLTGWTLTAMRTVESTDGNEHLLFGTAAGEVFRYGGGFSDPAAAAIDHVVRSQDYARSMTVLRKQLGRLDLTLRLTTAVTGATLSHVADGVVGATRTIPTLTGTGQQKVVRVFNAQGWDVGWRFRHNTAGETVDILQAVTQPAVVENPS